MVHGFDWAWWCKVLDRLSPKKQILEEGSIRLGMPFASSSSQTGNSSIGSPTAAGDTQVRRRQLHGEATNSVAV